MSTVLLPVFPGVPAWSGLRRLAGISCARVWVVVESALLRAGTLQTRGILLASYMVVYYLGTVLGQLLLCWFPSDMPLIVTEVCILSVAGMVPLMFARLEPGNGQVSSSSHIEIRTLLRRRSVFLGVVGCVISGVVLGTIYCLMPLFLKHQGMDHSSVGYWMALLIAAAILGQWPMGRLADRYGRAFVMKCQSLLVAAACAGLMLKGGLMAPSLIALGLAGFSLYPVAMAWGCEEASRDELVTMNQLLLLSYSLGTLAGPSLTSFLMQRYSDNWMPMVIALVALSFMPVLMLGGGHIAGWAVEDPARLARIDAALQGLGSQESFDAKYPEARGAKPLTLAVGDGNHSLASAKAYWEELKPTLTPEQRETHPARWCLAEVCNVHSPAIEIEPIHRVLFNVDCGAVLLALITWSDGNMAGICFGSSKKQSFTLAGPHIANVLSFEDPVAPLTVGTIDEFIEYFMARHKEARVDYVHDEPAVRALTKQGGVGFLLPPFEKSDLFKGIVMGGVLPRKTFSMGHAEEKRYYIECRKIIE